MDYVFGSVAREVTGIHDGGPLSPGYEPPAARAASTEQFVWGLDRILDGLSAWAGTKREGPSAHEGAIPPPTP
jgi:hypothetical protein